MVDARVASAFLGMTRDVAAERLRATRTAYGFVNGLADLGRHPALRRVTVETSAGPASIIAPPAIRDGAEPRLGKVPDIGEHDPAIRREFAQ
jgi:crotonobetainyl-CoA:carnitine CoA-transferase CaiB-like acyl-CoA transferase